VSTEPFKDETREYVIKDLTTGLYYLGPKGKGKTRWGPLKDAVTWSKSRAHNALGGLRNGTTNTLARVAKANAT
jgi:hypothetical protein